MSILREQVAQAMRDNNGPEHWTSPQLVPVGHYADAALAVVAEWLRSDEAVRAFLDAQIDPRTVDVREGLTGLADLIAGGE